MKALFLTFTFLISLFSFSLAQTRKDKEHKWGLSFAINDAHSQMAYYGEDGLAVDADGNMTGAGSKKNKSFSLSVIPKYYINTDWLLRFEYGITQIHLTNTNRTYSIPASASSSTSNMNDEIKQKINRYVAGIQFNFFANKRIESYGGISLQYISYADITRNLYTEHHDVNTDTLISWGKGDLSIPGGYAMGLGVFAGFNVFLQKHISLGAEFTSALLHYNVGGEYSEEYTYYYKPSPSGTVVNIMSDSYNGTRFTKIITSFNLSIWL